MGQESKDKLFHDEVCTSLFCFHSACSLYVKKVQVSIAIGEQKQNLPLVPLAVDGWEERKLGHSENFGAW